MQAQVTLVRHNPKQVNGKNGPFTIHEFSTEDGTTFDTSKTDIANAAYALLNQPVVLTYDETQRQGNNGTVYTNRRLGAVQAAANGTAAPSVLPSGAQTVPTSTGGGLPLAPAISPAPINTPDNAAPRIARAVAYEHLPEYVAAGLLAVPGSVNELYDVLGGLAKWIFRGSRPEAAAGADSSGAVVGGEVGAASAAPPPAEAQPTDDIPF